MQRASTITHAIAITIATTMSPGFILMGARPLAAGELVYRDRLAGLLVDRVPGILASYDAATGRFGSGIWICNDQHAMYPLAVAYAHQAPGNRHYRDRALLEVIMKAGDALIEDADARGQWVFRKKDGSTWGTIWMPWNCSRWARTFLLIRDDMPADRRQAWEAALSLGYSGISETQLRHVHNIPAHHAMELYVAGRALERPAWCEQAGAFLRKIARVQSEGGRATAREGRIEIRIPFDEEHRRHTVGLEILDRDHTGR